MRFLKSYESLVSYVCLGPDMLRKASRGCESREGLRMRVQDSNTHMLQSIQDHALKEEEENG